MDKNTKKQKTKNRNCFQLLMVIVFFILFVLLGMVNEILGMLMFGVFVFYSSLGNNNYQVEHKAYEEILQSKREILNYDREEEHIQNGERKTYASKWHLLVIVLMLGVAYFVSFVNMECAMLVFGIMICYIFFGI